MKRSIAILLGLPLFMAVGCAEEDAETASNSYGLNYEIGTYVVLDGKEFTETKNFVDLDGKVTQVDSLSATPTTTATGGVCQIDTAGTQTVSATEVTSTSKVRIAGRQQSWILAGSYGSAPGEGDVHVYGDPQNGQIFVNKPNLDIYVGTQAAAECNCRLDQYEQLTPVNLYVFEEDKDSTSKTTDVTTTKTPATKTVNTTIDDTSAAARRRTLGTFARFSLGDYIWQTTGSLAGLYTASPLNYNANMILPNSVAVGDTWIDNNGALVGAVGIEAVEVAGKNYAALHVVERGSTDIDLSSQGIQDWCINFYEDHKSDSGGGTVSMDSEITDMCNSTGAGVFAGQGVNGRATGWTNIRHTWYYEGLPIKIEEETVDVDVQEWGYALLNDGTLPGGIDAGNTTGQCARYYENTPTVIPADISKYKPYAEYSVSKTTRTFVASEIRAGYNLVVEYKEAKAAAAAAE